MHLETKPFGAVFVSYFKFYNHFSFTCSVLTIPDKIVRFSGAIFLVRAQTGQVKDVLSFVISPNIHLHNTA